ncbi:MAG: hypothetical protein WCX69_02205 [Candidatus Paceibacterota bacterium]
MLIKSQKNRDIKIEATKSLARVFGMFLEINQKVNPQLSQKVIGIFRLDTKDIFILANIFFAGTFLYKNEPFYCIVICLFDFLLLLRQKIRKISADSQNKKLTIDFFK